MNQVSLVIVLFCAVTISFAQNVPSNRGDQAFKTPCSPKDSCPSVANFTERHCECDQLCSSFGDCCYDAPGRFRRVPILHLGCLIFGRESDVGAYVIGHCPANYKGSEGIVRNCTYRIGHRDPLVSAPVTDVSSHVTYRNSYCAICHGVSVSSLRTWHVLLTCAILESLDDDYVWQALRYNSDIDRWGVDHGGDFHACKFAFDVPQYLSDHVRRCKPNVVYTCARDWTDAAVAERCRSYMGIVYTENEIYRNVDCAKCNRVDGNEISCNSGVTPKRNPFSFALLLDLNTSDGDRVGRTSRCSPGQKYDPFFKKCRTMQCALANFKISNGKCVRA